MICRCFFLCVIAYSLYRIRRLSKALAFTAIAVQTILLGAITFIPYVYDTFFWLSLALYSFYMDFFLIAFILYFYSWGSTSSPKIAIIVFSGSYVVSTVFYTVQFSQTTRLLVSLLSTLAIVVLLMQRGLFTEQAYKPSINEETPKLDLLLQQVIPTKVSSRLYSFWGLFGGSIFLLLIVFQIWFQLNNINPAANFEYQTPLYGFVAIRTLICYYVIFRRMRKKVIEIFPIVSLVIFLITQIAVLIFWQQAALVMAIITGMWFAVYQCLLFLWGQGFDSDDKPLTNKTIRYALGMGLTYCALAIGNLIARLVFGVEPITYSTLSTLSFIFTLLIVVALFTQLLFYFRRTTRATSTRIEPNTTTQNHTQDDLLDLLSSTYKITPREKDVLQLYLSGRTATRISEQLYLSESTVKTYIRRVYTKCDVHSREELLDLIDELDTYTNQE